MSVYLMLTTLTDAGRKALQEDPEILKEYPGSSQQRGGGETGNTSERQRYHADADVDRHYPG